MPDRLLWQLEKRPMLRTLAVVAACVGVNARPLPARPVGTLSEPFWGDAPGTTHPPAHPATHPTTVKTAAHKKAAAHKPAPTAHKVAPKHSLDDSHAHAPAAKHTLADGHTHSSPELAQPAADQAQLPARKLTKEERAAQKASEARDAVAVAAEAERAKAEAEKLGDQEKVSITDCAQH